MFIIDSNSIIEALYPMPINGGVAAIPFNRDIASLNTSGMMLEHSAKVEA